MAQVDTEICNIALSHLGHGKPIGALTEQSNEAKACALFFPSVRDEVLRDFPWPFATKFVTLVEVAQNPTIEWKYSYRMPTDCLFFRRILSGQRIETQDSLVPFRRAADDQGGLILTDKSAAQAEYTMRVENVALWPADFQEAVSYKLAFKISPRIAGAHALSLGKRAFDLYDAFISRAKATALTEQVPDQPAAPEWIRGR